MHTQTHTHTIKNTNSKHNHFTLVSNKMSKKIQILILIEHTQTHSAQFTYKHSEQYVTAKKERKIE